MNRDYKKIIAISIKQNLAKGKTVKGKLFGNSMIPTILPNQYIYLKQSENYIVGDIVAFDTVQNGYFVVHRIVSLEKSKFLIKGDNSLDIRLVDIDAIYGKVIKIEE